MTGTVHEPVRPVRDRATLLAYAQLGLLGWFVYAFGSSLTLVRDEAGLSRTAISLLSIALAVGGVLGSLVAAPIVRRYTRGTMLRAGVLLWIAGAAIYVSPAPFAVVLLGPLLASVGSSFAGVGANAFLEARQGLAGDAAITEGNTVASVGSLVGPFLVGIGATLIVGWRLSMLLLIVVAVALELLRGRNTSCFNVGEAPARRGADRASLPSLAWWSIATLVLLVSVEMVFISWGAELLRVQGGLGPAAASASVAAVVTGMLLGRLAGSLVVERVSGQTVLLVAIAITLVGFALTWMTFSALPMLLGLGITGFGMGTHFPLGISRAMRSSGGQPDRAAGFASAGIGVTSGAAPFLLALLADQWGVRDAFLLVPVFLLLALVLLVLKPVPDDLVLEPEPAATNVPAQLPPLADSTTEAAPR